MNQSNRLIDVLVYAPLGAGLYVLEVGPSVLGTLAARGRAEVEHQRETVGRHVTTVRSTGQVAVAFGLPMLRTKAGETLGRLGTVVFARAAEPETAPRPPAPAYTPPAPARPPAPASPSANGESANGADLPIPGYDALSASQVVERLIGLAPDELDVVRDYETSHRNRRTILGKIDQLAAPPA